MHNAMLPAPTAREGKIIIYIMMVAYKLSEEELCPLAACILNVVSHVGYLLSSPRG